MRKRSIKKHIEVGSVIKPKNIEQFYEVIELSGSNFKCKIITDDENLENWEQDFNYNIDMKVYKIIAENYE